MSDPSILRREVLAKFLPNLQAIIAFEEIIGSVSTGFPAALAALTTLVEELETAGGTTDTKANQALASLQSIAQSLSVMQAAPPPLPQLPAAQDLAPVAQSAIAADTIEVAQLREEVGLLRQAISELFAVPPGSTQAEAGTLTGTELATNVVSSSLTRVGASLTINSLDVTPVENTWTPAFTTDGVAGTPTHTAQTGTYTKFGRLVIAHGRCAINAWAGGPTGNLLISGLPFNPASFATGQAGFIGYVSGLTHTAGYSEFGMITANSADKMYMVESGSAVGAITVPVASVNPATLDLNFCAVYYV